MSTEQSRPFIAIPLMLTGSFMIVVQNTFAKLLGEAGLTPVEMVFYRNFGGLIIITLLILALNKPERFKTSRLKAQFTRAITGSICVGLIFWANTILPLATVSAIMLSSPIIATALSPLLLNERLSWIRGSCVLFGCIGALIITQPGTTDFDPRLLVAIIASIASAIVTITLRELGKTEDSLTTNFYFFVIGSLICLPAIPFLSPQIPAAPLLLCGIIAAGFLNQSLKTLAFRFAEVTVLSPFKYFNIVWATIIGWMIWAEIPESHVYIGCGIIIASNLLITLREHQLKKKKSNV